MSIHTFCPPGLGGNVVVYRGKPDTRRCEATSSYLNRDPIGAMETAQRYRELAERERATRDLHRKAASEAEKAMNTYLARAAIITGGDGGPDAAA